jgi:hypothetical protein
MACGLDLLIIPPAGSVCKAFLPHRAPAATAFSGGEICRCRRAFDQDPAGVIPDGVAEGRLSQMWGGDNPVSHAPGRGGWGAVKGHFFGDDLRLLPEQAPAGCEDFWVEVLTENSPFGAEKTQSGTAFSPGTRRKWPSSETIAVPLVNAMDAISSSKSPIASPFRPSSADSSPNIS